VPVVGSAGVDDDRTGAPEIPSADPLDCTAARVVDDERVPHVPDPDLVVGAVRPVHFTLGQPWLPTPEPAFRATRVAVRFAGGVLHVDADMDDDDVFNDATRHNERTWELGDVFEVFARRDDEERYVEVHVTPDNVRLHLRFADFAHVHRIASIDEVAADPLAIETAAERTVRGWRARVALPLPAAPGDVVRVSFCRYDATRGRPPVISSSSPHPEPSFHRPREWVACRIGH